MGNKTGPLDYLEHPVPLLGGEISKQDSYVSKGGPLGGHGDSVTVKQHQEQFWGDRSYIPSVISATRTSSTLKSPGIPTLPRWTFEGGTESCALSSHVGRFREDWTTPDSLFTDRIESRSPPNLNFFIYQTCHRTKKHCWSHGTFPWPFFLANVVLLY